MHAVKVWKKRKKKKLNLNNICKKRTKKKRKKNVAWRDGSVFGGRRKHKGRSI